MTLLSDAFREKLMDLRLRDKLLAEGKVTKEQVDKFLESLADDANSVSSDLE